MARTCPVTVTGCDSGRAATHCHSVFNLKWASPGATVSGGPRARLSRWRGPAAPVARKPRSDPGSESPKVTVPAW
eukprot:522885-Hanusia_phi.AAC.1